MIYLSLGTACQVAHQLGRLGLRSETMFYDWLVTHHANLINTLSFEFIDRLFQEGYRLEGNHLIENATGLSFYPHDFSGLSDGDIDAIDMQIASVREKYVRRAARTRDVLAHGGSVCVIRHFFEEPLENIPRQQEEIASRLTSLYPTTAFSFLWGSDFKADHLNSPFGYVHYLPKAVHWQGNDDAWNTLAEAIAYNLPAVTRG